MKYIYYTFIAILTLVQAYFLGLMLIWVLPTPGLSWPYSLIPGYLIGALLSGMISFLIFKKWRLEKSEKVIIAVIILVVIAFIGNFVSDKQAEALKMRAIEVLGN